MKGETVNECKGLSMRRMALAVIGAIVVASVAQADNTLEEIVVTAQKRAQNLQDVPLSITAIGNTDLARNDVFDLSRLDALVPGMKFGQSGNDARPAIRGTRTQNVIGNADPVVAYYVDGIYRSRPGQALSVFVDVERVEVLRGPQGTLFGRNSFGGAVNVISHAPDPSGVHAGVDLTVTNYQGVRAEGFVNLPFNDISALRIAGYSAKRNGWVENSVNPQNNLHDEDDQFGRAQFLIRPTDNLALTLRAEWWHGGGAGPGDFGYYTPGVPIDPATGKTNGVNGVLVRTLSADPTGARQGGYGGLFVPTPGDADPYHIARNFPFERRIDQRSFSADLTVGLGSFADLKAILSYTKYSEYRQGDADYSAQPLYYNFNNVTAKTGTEELQLTSKPGQAFNWVLGAYFLQDKPTDFYQFGSDGTRTSALQPYGSTLFAPTATDPNLYVQGPYRLDTKASAAYLDVNYAVTSAFRVLGGARYTRDKKSAEYDNPDFVFDTAPATHKENTYSRTTWRGGLEFDIAKKSMLYATASTGFQSGGFNGSSPSLKPFDQTTVKAYEVGSKNELLGGTLRVNVALYANDYTNLLSQRLVQVGNAISSYQANAGAVKARGAELELDWSPVQAAHLGLRTSYNHSRFGDFVTGNSFTEGGNLPNGGFQLNGYQVPLNPNFTNTLLASYDIQAGLLGVITPDATVYYSSSYRTSDQPYFFAAQKSYATLDLRLRWRPSDDAKVSGELFCENCSNQTILLRTTPNGGSVAYQDFAPPRIYGLRVSYHY